MKIAVADLETTGFSPAKDLIVETGIVLLDLETGEIEEKLNSLVREPTFGPEHRRAWVFSHSDLTHERVMAEGKPSEDVYRAVSDILKEFPVAAWNVKFDMSFLKARNIGPCRVLSCPMVASTPFLKLTKARGSGYKWPKFPEAWAFYFPDRPYTEAHRAADDARHEAEVIKRMFDLGHWKPGEETNDG